MVCLCCHWERAPAQGDQLVLVGAQASLIKRAGDIVTCALKPTQAPARAAMSMLLFLVLARVLMVRICPPGWGGSLPDVGGVDLP